MSDYTIKAIEVRTSACTMAELNHRHNDFNKHMQDNTKNRWKKLFWSTTMPYILKLSSPGMKQNVPKTW